MPKMFKANPGVGTVVLPGVGKVAAGQILVGDEFSRYAPRFLTEVLPEPASLPLEQSPPPGPQVLVETKKPASVPPQPGPEASQLAQQVLDRVESVPPPPPSSEEASGEDEEPILVEKRGPGRPRKH
jgi:hypothetical protein